jgi:hypothetical protein
MGGVGGDKDWKEGGKDGARKGEAGGNGDEGEKGWGQGMNRQEITACV